jgi:uncharacterized membrane protein
MATHEHSIEVTRPVRTVYNQWTQFETFPQFMDGVESVTQVDSVHNHWVTKVGGATREFDTEITEQVPDHRIAWNSTSGADHSGMVTFHALGDHSSRVTLRMDFDPEGLVESAGDKLGVVGHRLEGDLERFKKFIESQPVETGAWRGEISSDPMGQDTGLVNE